MTEAANGSWPADRRTLTSLSLQCGINAFVYSTYLARLPEIRDQSHVSTGAMGIVMMIGNLAGLLATFVTKPVIRRLGSKPVMIWGAVAYVGALPIIGNSSSRAPLIIGILVMMIMNSFVDVAIARQSTDFSAARGRSVMSRLAGVYSLGTLAGGLLAAAIGAVGFDVSIHLIILAGLLAGALILVAPGLLPSDSSVRDATRANVSRWGSLLPLALLGLASAAAAPLDSGPGEWATFRVTDDLHASSAAAALAYAAFTAGMCVGRLAGDWLAAKTGTLRLLLISVGLSAAGLTIACIGPIVFVSIAGFMLAGFGCSVQTPLLTEVAGRGEGARLTAFFVGNRIAGLLTPLVIGSLANSFVAVGTAIMLATIPCAVVLGAVAPRVWRASASLSAHRPSGEENPIASAM